MIRLQALLILSVAALAGCQSAGLVYSSDRSGHRVTEIILLQPLGIAPDTTRVFVQDGQVLPRGGKGGSYRTRCAFEVRYRSELAQTIQPATFRVTRVQRLTDPVVEHLPIQVATLRFADMDDGGAPMVHSGYHFWLESEQPGVRRMSCYGVLADLGQDKAPTIEEIRRALDGVAELSTQP